jgi:hypothetical protein
VSVVFLDPSGRRWHKLRVAAAAITALVVLGLVLIFPKLVDTPALTALGEPLGPSLTSADTGMQVPLVTVWRSAGSTPSRMRSRRRSRPPR